MNPRVIKKRVRRVPRERAIGVNAKRSAAAIVEDLTVEFYSLVRLALKRFGATPAQQERAIRRSRHLRQAPRVSGPVLRDVRGLSALLLEWSRETEYLDPHGKPRVLAIAGPGSTFETLAKRFLPDMPLDEVVSMACETAEVVRRPKKRIALLGSILVRLVKSREKYLAHAIRQIDQLLETMLHNRAITQNGTPRGRMERMVSGIISRAKYPSFMRELRPQIYDLLLRVDSAAERHRPRGPRALSDATAINVGMYVSQEEDLERAGVDASSLSSSKRRHRKRKKAP